MVICPQLKKKLIIYEKDEECIDETDSQLPIILLFGDDTRRDD